MYTILVGESSHLGYKLSSRNVSNVNLAVSLAMVKYMLYNMILHLTLGTRQFTLVTGGEVQTQNSNA